MVATAAQASPIFTEEHELFREQVRRFVDEEVKPHGDKWEAAGMVPRAVLRKMGQLGFLGIRYGEQYGGAAQDSLFAVILAEELGRSTFGGFAITVLVHTDMASPHLNHAGTAAQKAKWLPGVCDGSLITAVAMTEPDAGSDLQGMKTRAAKSADGSHYVLNGAKMFITNGVHADLYFVAAKTDPQAKGSRGITMFAIEKGTPGFSIARPLDKMGWRCSDTAELVFQDCVVPAANVLGEENRGFYSLVGNLQTERLAIGAMCLGECQAAIDITLQYVTTRKAFGAPLWDKQAIRHRMAALAARVEAAKQLIYLTAWRDAMKQPCVKEVSMIKALMGDLVNEVMFECLQFHGGMGYIRECAIERMTRDARVQAIGGGATEVMLEEIAKRMV